MRNTTRLFVGLLTATALAACSDSSGPSTTPLSADNAQEVGAAVASSVELAVGALAPMAPDFTGGFPLFSISGRSLRGGLSFAPRLIPSGCPAVGDLTDSDGDGVPDNATWTFTAANCTETDIEGNKTVTTGTVVVSDPGLTPGYNLAFNAFTTKYYEGGATTPTIQLALNGSWALRGTSDALSLDQDYSFVLSYAGQGVTLDNDLQVDFTATGGPIAWGEPLPDGTLFIDGAWHIASSQENHALTLETTTPLSYDDACGGIVAGVMEAQGNNGSVQVTWNACQDYTSTFVPN